MWRIGATFRVIVFAVFLLFLTNLSYGGVIDWEDFFSKIGSGETPLEFDDDIVALSGSQNIGVVGGSDDMIIDGSSHMLNASQAKSGFIVNANRFDSVDVLTFMKIKFENFLSALQGSVIRVLGTNQINFKQASSQGLIGDINFRNNFVNSSAGRVSAQGGAIYAAANGSGAENVMSFTAESGLILGMNLLNNRISASGAMSKAQGGFLFGAGNTTGADGGKVEITFDYARVNAGNNSVTTTYDTFSQAQGGAVFLAASVANAGAAGAQASKGKAILTIENSSMSFNNNSVSAKNQTAAQGGGFFIAGAVANGTDNQQAVADVSGSIDGYLEFSFDDLNSFFSTSYNNVSVIGNAQAQGGGFFVAGAAAQGYAKAIGKVEAGAKVIFDLQSSILRFDNNRNSASGAYSQVQGGGFFAAGETAGAGANAGRKAIVSSGVVSVSFDFVASDRASFSGNTLNAGGANSQAQGGGLFAAGTVLGSLSQSSGSSKASISIDNGALNLSNNTINAASFSQGQGGGLFFAGLTAGGQNADKSISAKSQAEFTIKEAQVSLSNNKILVGADSQAQGGGIFIAGVTAGGATSNSATIGYAAAEFIAESNAAIIAKENTVSAGARSQAQGGGVFIAGVVANGIGNSAAMWTLSEAGNVIVDFGESRLEILSNKAVGENSQGGGLFIGGAVAGGQNSRAVNTTNDVTVIFDTSILIVNANEAQGNNSKGGGIFIAGNVSAGASAQANAGASLSILNGSSVSISNNSADLGGGLYAVSKIGAGAVGSNLTQIDVDNSKVYFIGNKARIGAAIYADDAAGAPTLSVNFVNSTVAFINNESSGGNGILFWNNNIPLIDFGNSEVLALGNKSVNGGFLALDGSKRLVFGALTQILGNRAVNLGGGVYLSGNSRLKFEDDVNISTNTALRGAALYIEGNAGVEFEGDVEISFNNSTGGDAVVFWTHRRGGIPITFGGAKFKAIRNIANNGSLFFLNNNVVEFENTILEIEGNRARGFGGAIYAANASSIIFTQVQGGFAANTMNEGRVRNDIYMRERSLLLLNGGAAGIDIRFDGGIYSDHSNFERGTGNEIKIHLSGDNYFLNHSVVELPKVNLEVENADFVYSNGDRFNIDGSTVVFKNSTTSFINISNRNIAALNLIGEPSSVTFINTVATFEGNTKAVYINGPSSVKFIDGEARFINNSNANGEIIKWENGAEFNITAADVYARGNSALRGGFLYSDGMEMSIRNIITIGNVSFSSGGAILLERSTIAFVNTSHETTFFIGNRANLSGGALYLDNSLVTVAAGGAAHFSSSVFRDNWSSRQGANDIYMQNNSELNIQAHRNGFVGLYSGIVSSGNKVDIYGSDIPQAPGIIEISGNIILENTPLTIRDNAFVTILDAQFSYKRSHIGITTSSLRILRSNASLTNNISENGAIADMFNSYLIINASRVSLENSTAAIAGGAIRLAAENYGGIDIDGSNVDFIKNRAIGDAGGAISATGRKMTMNISNSVVNFTGNAAISSGGALGAFSILKDEAMTDFIAPNSTFVISNSRVNFTNNLSSAGTGGGASFSSLLSLSIINSQISFASNRATSGGGAFIEFGERRENGAQVREPDQTTNIENSRLDFSGNSATTDSGGKGQGGALAIEATYRIPDEPEWNTIVQISRSTLNFSSNSADIGGALFAGMLTGPININANNSDITFTDNEARRGGAAFIGTPVGRMDSEIVSALNFAFNNSRIVFERNKALESGGALSVIRGSIVSFNSSQVLFKDNRAVMGGALYLGILNDSDNAPSISFIDSDTIFEGNSAAEGAAIFIRKDIATSGAPLLNARVEFIGGSVEFINNISTSGSGIVYFDDAQAENGGAGIGEIVFNDARVLARGNEAFNGGFLYLNSALVTYINYRPREIHFMGDAALISNRARQSGGALYLISPDGETSSLTDVKFGYRITGDSSQKPGTDTNISANTAVSSGGAVFVKDDAKLDFEWTRLTASGNISKAAGGFIYVQDADLTLNGQAQIENNQALLGGALYFENNSLTALKHLQIIGQHGDIIFASNKAHSRGGAIYIKGVDINAKSVLTLKAETSNVVFRDNSAGNISNDIYLDNFSKLVLDSSGRSVAIMSGIRAPQINEIMVENNGGLNIIGGNVNVLGKAAINDGILAFSANAGTSTVYGQGGFVHEITVEPNAVLKIDPSAASKIENSGYAKIYADHSNPKIARIKADTITMKGNLIMNVNVDEAAYGQLVMAYGGTIDNVETSTFTAIVEGRGVAAGTLVVWEHLNGQSGASSFANTFGKVDIFGGNDFEVLLFVSTSNAQVKTNGYFGRFAVVNYFDFDSDLRRLNYSQSRAGANLYAAHKAGADAQNGDIKNLLIAATANTAPGADPTGYKGRQIFDMLSGSFIANVLKQSALNNTEGLYRRMDRDIKENQSRDKFEESISDKGWAYLTFSGVQYDGYKANVREFKSSHMGFQGGADMIVWDDLLAGAYFGYSRGSYRQGEDRASLNGIEAGLYGGYFWDMFNFKASLGLGLQNVGIKRNISIDTVSMEGYDFPGYDAHTKAQFNLYTVKYAAEAELVSEVGNEMDVRPFIAFQGGTVYNGEIKESGGGSANLIINSGKYDRLAALYGLRIVENGFENTIRWRASLYGGYVINGSKAQYEAKFLDNNMTIYSLGENLAFWGVGGGIEYDINEKIFAFSSLDINKNNGFMGYSVQIGASYRLGRKQGGRIRDRMTPALKAQANTLIVAILNSRAQDWMSQETEKGNTQTTMDDAMKALRVEKGMRVYVVEADGKLFYFDVKDDAEAFVNQLSTQGAQITKRDIHTIAVDDDQIKTAQNEEQERTNIRVYESGAVEIVPIDTGGGGGAAVSGSGTAGGSGRRQGGGGGRVRNFNEPVPQAAEDTGVAQTAASIALQTALHTPTTRSNERELVGQDSQGLTQEDPITGQGRKSAMSGVGRASAKNQQLYNLSFGATVVSVASKLASVAPDTRENAGTMMVGDNLGNRDASSLGGSTVHYPIGYAPIVIDDIFTTPLQILSLPSIGESIESGPGKVIKSADIIADIRRQEREEINKAQKQEKQSDRLAMQERRERQRQDEVVSHLALKGTPAAIGNRLASGSSQVRKKAGTFKVGYMLEDTKTGSEGVSSTHYPLQWTPIVAADIFIAPHQIFSLPAAGEDMEKEMPGKIRKGDVSITLEQEEEAMASMTSQARENVVEAHYRRIFSEEIFRLAVAEFEMGYSELTDASKASIKDNSEDLLKKKFELVTIEGHTDSTGSADINRELSAKRAEAVYNEYIKNGIPKEKLSFVGLGPDFPVADNSTFEGRQKNRRVEIFIE